MKNLKKFKSILHFIFDSVVICIKSIPFSFFFLVNKFFIGRKILIFDSQDKLFKQFFNPMIRLIELDPRFRNVLVYYTSTTSSVKTYTDSIVKMLTLRSSCYIPNILFRYIVGYDLYITAHFYSQIKNPDKSILIQHNLPVKYLFPPLNSIRNSKIQFMTGELHTKQFNAALKHYEIDPSYFTIHKIGFPKLDDVFNNKFEKTKLLAERNLSLSKKTILYAPSWDEGLSLKFFGTRIIEKIADMSEKFNIIIRLHPALFTPDDSINFDFYAGGIDWLSLLQRFKSYNDVYISTESNSNYDLVCADLLISDVSSIAWDFLLLGKPILLFSSDEYYSSVNPVMYSQYGNSYFSAEQLKRNEIINGGRDYAVLFNNLEELDIKILSLMTKTVSNQIDFKALSHNLVYNPGYASTRALDVISNYLFGPGKILDHVLDKTRN